MRLPVHPRSEPRSTWPSSACPTTAATSYRPGARYGPRHIRDQSSLIRPWNPVLEVAPFERAARGRLWRRRRGRRSRSSETFDGHRARAGALVAAGVIPLAVGGDHSITLPMLRALARRHGPLGLVHFDSHPDTWGEYAGSYHYHGSTFRRAIEEGIVDGAPPDPDRHPRPALRPRRLRVPRRARARGDPDRATVKEHGVAARARARAPGSAGGPVYCSFDIDARRPRVRAGDGHARGRRAHVSYEALELVRGAPRASSWSAPTSSRSRRRTTGPAPITSLLAANLLFELLSLFALGPERRRGRCPAPQPRRGARRRGRRSGPPPRKVRGPRAIVEPRCRAGPPPSRSLVALLLAGHAARPSRASIPRGVPAAAPGILAMSQSSPRSPSRAGHCAGTPPGRP